MLALAACAATDLCEIAGHIIASPRGKTGPRVMPPYLCGLASSMRVVFHSADGCQLRAGQQADGLNRGGAQFQVRACTEAGSRRLVLATMRPGVTSATIGGCARPC